MMKNLKKLLNNEGYTFIEVFLTMLIIALISTIIYTNSSSILDSLNKSRDNLSVKHDLLLLRNSLKREALKITPPWFFKEYLIEEDEESLNIFYYNGIKEESLKLYANESGIKVEVNGTLVFISNNLFGKFIIEDGSIYYIDETYKIMFPLGVFLA